MLKVLQPSRLSGEVQAIASKSVAHRLLIGAALADKPTLIKGRFSGRDIRDTASCLRALGAKITQTGDSIKVIPIIPPYGESILDCGESGSTLRFMLPLACALGKDCVFIGKGRLKERSIAPLLDVLKAKGAAIDGSALPLKVKGQLHSGQYTVPANISSQYITGLLLALPTLSGDSSIILQSEAVSKPYIDITLQVLHRFGVEISRKQDGFAIKGSQKYRSCGELSAEGDWSNAAFFIVGGVISGDVTVSGLNQDSLQGDKKIIDILMQMGADITVDGGKIRAKQSLLNGINIDAQDIPDLVPILAVAAMQAGGSTVFCGVDRLRDKESDRLAVIMHTIKLLGGRSSYSQDTLTVFGKSGGYAYNDNACCDQSDACCDQSDNLGGKSSDCGDKNNNCSGKSSDCSDTDNGYDKGSGCGDKSGGCGYITLSAHNDHRIAMSIAIAALSYNGKIYLKESESVGKSYTEFFQDYTKLGGIAYEQPRNT